MANGKRRRDNSYVTDEIAKKLKTLNSMLAINAEDLVKYADKAGYFLAKEIKLTTSQIRRFLDAVNSIRYDSIGKEETYPYKDRVLLLKPKLAYAAGRDNKNQVKHFMTLLDPCMDRVTDGKDFERFHQLVEAIVAYHKYHGGRDS